MAPRSLVAAAAAAVVLALAAPPARDAGPRPVSVDANLVTALDASDSVMRHEEWIEVVGLLRAVSHPEFLAAIRAGPRGRIGFAAFAWSSGGPPRLVVPWTVIGSPEDAARVARALAATPWRWDAGAGSAAGPEARTDVSAALRFGLDLLAAAPHPAARWVLNVCGDGVDNVGEGPDGARDAALAAGVTVNGLVLGGEPGVAAYYRERVVGGPGSFVLEARDPADVRDAMRRKLLLDLTAGAASGRSGGAGGEA